MYATLPLPLSLSLFLSLSPSLPLSLSGFESGKIWQLFSSDDFGPLSRVALVNAVYFKGSWQQPFPRENTALRGFTKRDGSVAHVPMMYHKLQANIGGYSSKLYVVWDSHVQIYWRTGGLGTE